MDAPRIPPLFVQAAVIVLALGVLAGLVLLASRPAVRRNTVARPEVTPVAQVAAVTDAGAVQPTAPQPVDPASLQEVDLSPPPQPGASLMGNRPPIDTVRDRFPATKSGGVFRFDPPVEQQPQPPPQPAHVGRRRHP